MMMFRLEVTREGFVRKRTVLKYNGRDVRVPTEFEADVEKLPVGTIEAGCEYRPGGLVLAELNGRTVTIAAYQAPVVKRQEDDEARRALNAIGEKEIPSIAHDLAREVAAMLQRDERDRAAKIFPILLGAATRTPSSLVDPIELATIRRELPASARKQNAEMWLQWITAHRETGAPDSLADDIPMSSWPIELVRRGLQWYCKWGKDYPGFRALLAEMKRRAPEDASVAAAEKVFLEIEQVQSRYAENVEKAREAQAKNALNHPARVDTIELGFKISLPAELARAWRRGHPRLRPLGEITLAAMLDEAEKIRAAHFPEDPAPAFLPLAKEGAATIGLYLGTRRPCGDFAVLRVADVPELVENESVAWLR